MNLDLHVDVTLISLFGMLINFIDQQTIVPFRWDHGGKHVYILIMQGKPQACRGNEYDIIHKIKMTPVYL